MAAHRNPRTPVSARHAAAASPRLHPRNRHQGRYDFPLLVRESAQLKRYLRSTPDGEPTIDFADPEAVRALNAALMQSYYGIVDWQFPDGYLCPPVPGRADYIHALADLLADSNQGLIPRDASVRVLDIGTGASCIYPLVGQCEYGWHFVGSDIDTDALKSAAAILKANPAQGAHIELRHQATAQSIFSQVLEASERFDLVMCNPPFHASAREASAGSQRKWQNLGREQPGRGSAKPGPKLNFGGRGQELWCPGGELAFIQRMSIDSVDRAQQVLWFTSLVSKSAHLPRLKTELQKLGASEIRIVPMAQGQKQSRFLAWTFLDAAGRERWRQQRWTVFGANPDGTAA